MHSESHLYVNLRRQTRKNDFWGRGGGHATLFLCLQADHVLVAHLAGGDLRVPGPFGGGGS